MTTNSDYELVRVLFADQLNLARGKYIPSSIAHSGHARFCLGTYALTYSKDLVPAPGSGLLDGLPDIEARFDPEALRPSWEPNTKIALADLYLDGEPADLCGRGALKRAITAWQALGFEPMIGLEAEAYVFEQDVLTEKWVPYQASGGFVYGTGAFSDPKGIMHEIWSSSLECNLPLESFCGEFDVPQIELAMQYDHALKACDDFFLFKQMSREVLLKQEFLLSFMPKPIPGISGSGLHINLSFKGEDGKNVFAGANSKDNMSDLVKGCIAGLLHHHEALGGIVAPIVNSYERLQPASLAGCWANWGFDHRSVGVRVSAETGPGARIEHRVGDCAVNPYLAVAAVLHAARLGCLNKYALPECETNDGLETVNTDRRVASSLEDSLNYLEGDTALVNAIGKPLIDNYLFIKRAEVDECKGKSTEEIFDYYAPFI